MTRDEAKRYHHHQRTTIKHTKLTTNVCLLSPKYDRSRIWVMRCRNNKCIGNDASLTVSKTNIFFHRWMEKKELKSKQEEKNNGKNA